MAYVEINAQSERGLVMEAVIAIPFSFLVLVGVFGGLLAAAVPLAVGIWAIVGSMALLYVLHVPHRGLHVRALNLTIAMGLALAVDYTLLIVSRFREERAAPVAAGVDEALCTTMTTAGRRRRRLRALDRRSARCRRTHRAGLASGAVRFDGRRDVHRLDDRQWQVVTVTSPPEPDTPAEG